MKHKLLIVLFAIILLSVVIIFVSCNDSVQLQWAIRRYQSALDNKDLTLTIYYMYGRTVRLPQSVEDLIARDDTIKIVVKADELAKNLDLLGQLNTTTVKPAKEVKEGFFLDAQFAYVFETDDSEKLLEVAMRQMVGDSEAVAAFVNGIAVEKDPILYEIILRFLTEEDRENLGFNILGFVPEEEGYTINNSPVDESIAEYSLNDLLFFLDDAHADNDRQLFLNDINEAFPVAYLRKIENQDSYYIAYPVSEGGVLLVLLNKALDFDVGGVKLAYSEALYINDLPDKSQLSIDTGMEFEEIQELVPCTVLNTEQSSAIES